MNMKPSAKVFQSLIILGLILVSQSELQRINPTGPISSEVAGIILSFHDDHSYDKLFSQVKQESKEGSVVLTYVASSSEARKILNSLTGKFQNAQNVLRQFAGEIQKLTVNCPSCIVFNWECSSGYSDQSFNEGADSVFSLLEVIIKRGYIAMFSDFSLKALIKEWRTQILGQNPFVKVGETSTPINLKFDKQRLLRSPSSQLQAVAQLARGNQLQVHVLGGTIMYAVDSRARLSEKYQLQVLTVASNFKAPHSYFESKIGEAVGLASHVLLSYKSGGKLLTSMGHWIQLMRIDTTKQQLFQATQSLYGNAQYQKVKRQYLSLQNEADQKDYLMKKSKMFVQNQSPGSNKIYMQETKYKNAVYDL